MIKLIVFNWCWFRYIKYNYVKIKITDVILFKEKLFDNNDIKDKLQVIMIRIIGDVIFKYKNKIIGLDIKDCIIY